MADVVFRSASSLLEGKTSDAWTTTIGLPFGTVVGDVVVVVASKRRDAGSISVSDARFQLVHSSQHGSVYAGYASHLGGLTLSFSGFPSGSQNFSNIASAAWGNAELNLTGLATDHTTAIPAVVPGYAAPSSQQRLVLAMTAAPFVGSGGAGGTGEWNTPDSFAALTAGGGGTSQFEGTFASWSGIAATASLSTAADTTSWGGANPTNHFGVSSAIFTLGPILTVAPPCRLFPRGDGLGVGGGRHFPPSKSQQRSGRRFGYY